MITLGSISLGLLLVVAAAAAIPLGLIAWAIWKAMGKGVKP
jgi:hypothetical protein